MQQQRFGWLIGASLGLFVGFAPQPATASPITIYVGGLVPGDVIHVKVPNANGTTRAEFDIKSTSVPGPGSGAINGIAYTDLDKDGKLLPAGWLRIRGIIGIENQPTAERVPATISTPVAPPPAPPGGTGGGTSGAGVGAGASAEIPGDGSELSIFSFAYLDDIANVVTVPGRFSLGFNNGFVASYDALVGDTFVDVFDGLEDSLLANGIGVQRSGRSLFLFGPTSVNNAAISSYVAQGLRFSSSIQTAEIPEPTTLMLLSTGIAGLTNHVRRRRRPA